MADIRHVAVIDIGKTNAKVAMVDLETLSETEVRKTVNRPLPDGPYRHHDVEAIWNFILESLAALGREQRVDAISVTTHGATAVLLGADRALAMPVLDYEDSGPDMLRERYDAVRPEFEETGSPALPFGLNLGAQLFWQSETYPEAFARVAKILTYPQYWSWRLTGIAASEVTSLGCHTDLWNPYRGDFSTLVDHMAWRRLFPPLKAARAPLGSILPELALSTGIGPSTPVQCGIHDSNASLLPHLLARQAPFSVVSTGTWVVSMAIGGRKTALEPARDTLVNVNAFGDPVPSARFMGGREFEVLSGGVSSTSSDEDLASVLDRKIMLLPSVQQGSGPFPTATAHWTDRPSPGERNVAIAFYLAMMTATCLDLIGGDGSTVIEGPFAANQHYCDMLQAATERPVLPQSGQATGTSIGAALLASAPRLPPVGQAERANPPYGWSRYAQAWREAVKTL
ncbi:carbohydrate kinase [Mesorhizobium sp. Root157]|uniref:FGGY-family carbohydrate kinase n=1 Tax=Mesorhizobium sp. Root157 TaxID=1736477 RepID=UPI0006F901C3|nr:FGGY-family carbohydrate kinase [Mesorhizobium sp. Root157]KQZ82880.1 carbohydrate kinase [Mesorhizobium sp. Root157]